MTKLRFQPRGREPKTNKRKGGNVRLSFLFLRGSENCVQLQENKYNPSWKLLRLRGTFWSHPIIHWAFCELKHNELTLWPSISQRNKGLRGSLGRSSAHFRAQEGLQELRHRLPEDHRNFVGPEVAGPLFQIFYPIWRPRVRQWHKSQHLCVPPPLLWSWRGSC